MATTTELTRLALGLPGVEGAGVDFSIGKKAICWAYLARATPSERRGVVSGVMAIRCALPTKDMLIAAAPDRFFDDDHYRGYPAVLCRLSAIDVDELAGLLRAAWMLQAPATLRKSTPL